MQEFTASQFGFFTVCVHYVWRLYDFGIGMKGVMEKANKGSAMAAAGLT